MPRDALYVRIKHATIAHGFVKSVDTSAAEQIPGVVKVLTCFDVPEHPFPTAGHPWSMDPGHQDVADRHLLNRHVRYYGDEVAAVVSGTLPTGLGRVPEIAWTDDFANVDSILDLKDTSNIKVYEQDTTDEANAVLQTKDGYLWVGSYGGLLRFDGSKFHNLSTEGAIATPSIRCLFEDSAGRL